MGWKTMRLRAFLIFWALLLGVPLTVHGAEIDPALIAAAKKEGRLDGTFVEQAAQAGQREVVVLALAQLNRGVETRGDGRPRLSDLRESGSLEADADQVWLLHRKSLEAAEATVYVAKNRNGATGELGLGFERQCTRWTDPAAPKENDGARDSPTPPRQEPRDLDIAGWRYDKS